MFGIESVAVRGICALLFSFTMSMFLYPKFILIIKNKQFGQQVRELGPKSHLSKQGTPTMGGLVIVFQILFSSIFFGDLSSINLLILLAVMLGFTLLGFLDDKKKITKKSSNGLSAKAKYLSQSAISVVAIYSIYNFTSLNGSNNLMLPFLSTDIELSSWLYMLLAYFVIVGSSNAVNLTDGLDGLVSIPIIIVLTSFILISSLASSNASIYNLSSIIDGDEIIVFACIAIGSIFSFLFFNANPAKLFMGDVGSLSLGAVLGTIALMLKVELIFFIMAMVFVIETMSVIIQVLYFKKTKKRFFKMAPIHHHFEMSGWSENQVVVRFWIASILGSVIALLALFA